MYGIHNRQCPAYSSDAVQSVANTSTRGLQPRVQGVGPRGLDPPLLQLMVAFIHVIITIIYSQKYVLFEIMYTQIVSFHSYHMVQGHIWDFKYSDR